MNYRIYIKDRHLPIQIVSYGGEEQAVVVTDLVIDIEHKSIHCKTGAGLIPIEDLREATARDLPLMLKRWTRDQMELREWDGIVRVTVGAQDVRNQNVIPVP